MTDLEQENQNSTESTCKIVYILYLVGIVAGITGLIGVIIAYVNHSDAPDWLKSHYRFQIRTFWIGAIYLILGSVLMIVLVGWLVLLFWVVWLILRVIKGMKHLDARQAHPDPTTWMF